jgi:hypothetical protein
MAGPNRAQASSSENGLRMDGATPPEVVAYRLLLHVMEAEGRPLVGGGASSAKVSRNAILDAYADCLEAVRGERQKKGIAPKP